MKRYFVNIYLVLLFIYSFYRFTGESLISSLRNYNSYISLICDCSLIAVGLLSIERINIYLKLFILFIITSTISYLINTDQIGILSHLNGLRQYLILFSSLIFCYNIIESKYWYYFHSKFKNILIVVLIFHLITSVFQFIKHGASDAVGGGFDLGGSGILTLLVFSSVFFLIYDDSKVNNNEAINFSNSIKYYILILPALINETKITFIILPLFFILQLRLNFANILNTILISFGLVIVFFIYSEVYNNIAPGAESNIDNPIRTFTDRAFLEHYLFRQNTDSYNVSRMTKIIIGFEILSTDLNSLLFGKGLGLFKGFDLLGLTEFTSRYQWLFLGTNNYIFFTFIQLGLVGSFVIIITLLIPFLSKESYKIHTFSYLRFKIFILIIIILMLFYNVALKEGGFVLVFSYFLVHILKYPLFYDKWESTKEIISNRSKAIWLS